MWELTRNCLSYLCHLYRQAFDPTHPSICTTFIFGTALQNFGTRTDSFLERPAWFAQSKYVQHFSMLISERRPRNKNDALKFVSPCAFMTAVHIWFQAHFRDQKENGRFSSAKSNFMSYCFKQAKTLVANEGLNKFVPWTTLTWMD